MAFIVTGTVTFSNQTNRDAALTRINNVLPDYQFAEIESIFPAGIDTSNTTTITLSLHAGEDPEYARAFRKAIYDALVQVPNSRQTQGYVSVNKV